MLVQHVHFMLPSYNAMKHMRMRNMVNVHRSGVCRHRHVNVIFSEAKRQSCFNPLSPHDALKHHFTSLKTDLIFLQLRVLERKFPLNWLTNTWQFSLFLNHIKSSSSTTSRELRQQLAACSG